MKPYGIVPRTVVKDVRAALHVTQVIREGKLSEMMKDKKKREKMVASLEKEMKRAAKELNFERAAQLDIIINCAAGRGDQVAKR